MDLLLSRFQVSKADEGRTQFLNRERTQGGLIRIGPAAARTFFEKIILIPKTI
jgi:hypothetical protein